MFVPIKPGFHMIVSVVRIVSVASNFWFWDDYMETLSGTTETILTTETTQSSEIDLSSILATETIRSTTRSFVFFNGNHFRRSLRSNISHHAPWHYPVMQSFLPLKRQKRSYGNQLIAFVASIVPVAWNIFEATETILTTETIIWKPGFSRLYILIVALYWKVLWNKLDVEAFKFEQKY